MQIVYHIYQPLRSGRIWHKVNLMQIVYLLFSHTFPKGISAMWNSDSLYTIKWFYLTY